MNTRAQFIRFAIVGLVSNFLLFLLYLAAVAAGAGPKSAMSVLYALGVAWTFTFNRNWSFGHEGMASPAFMRYIVIYVAGYAVNWLVLLLFVDQWHWPHQWVQACMIVILAAALFFGQKFWVFRPS